MNNNKIILLTLLSSLSFLVNADVLNGNFETWSNGNANNWTTVDSGINVSQNTTTVKTGTSSAAITVNTVETTSTLCV